MRSYWFVDEADDGLSKLDGYFLLGRETIKSQSWIWGVDAEEISNGELRWSRTRQVLAIHFLRAMSTGEVRTARAPMRRRYLERLAVRRHAIGVRIEQTTGL
jgi:hypothetical protein